MGYLSFVDDVEFPINTPTLRKCSESHVVPANHFSVSPADGANIRHIRQECRPRASLVCAISLTRMTGVYDCGPQSESEANELGPRSFLNSKRK